MEEASPLRRWQRNRPVGLCVYYLIVNVVMAGSFAHVLCLIIVHFILHKQALTC